MNVAVEKSSLSSDCDTFKANIDHTLANLLHSYANNRDDCLFCAYHYEHELDEHIKLTVVPDKEKGASSQTVLSETLGDIYSDLFQISEGLKRLREPGIEEPRLFQPAR